VASLGWGYIETTGTALRHLWLLRHAKSSWDDPGLDDHDRPLSPRGERAAAAMASHLSASGVQPRLVLCSSALRARQTLGLVLASLGNRGALAIEIDPELYTFDAGVLLERLRSVPDSVTSLLLVGHNPAVQELALLVAAHGALRDRVAAKLPTGAVVTIALADDPWSTLGEGNAEIEGLVVPRDLEGSRGASTG
jgi:phosphohistidine phosphatase